MSLSRRRFNQTLLAVLAAGALPALPAAELLEGRDWKAIKPPQPGESEHTIEVIEFFSYGCPHCRHLHPLVTAWSKGLPEDVALTRVPVSFGRAAWANLVRLYYALELTGDLGRLDEAVFEALHVQRTQLYTKDKIVAWVEGQGVDAKAFAEAFDSFAVQMRLNRSDQLVRKYRVDAVPLITVDGRYAVVGQATKGYADLLVIADGLIEQARARRAASAASAS
jgi:thiol:disulfide interchange protein DsbA